MSSSACFRILAFFLLLAQALSLPSAGRARADESRAFSPDPYYAREKWMDVGGARICYLDEGGGEVMVLVHGWAGNAWNWEAVFGPLSKNHRVIVLDLPGHGKSGCPKGFGFSMREYAGFVVGVMNELKVERATIIGSSMGGAIAAWTTVLHPERVDRLVLVDAAGTSVQNPLLKAAGLVMTKSTVVPLIHLVFPVNEETLAGVPESERKRVKLAEELYKSDRKKCAGKALARAMRGIGRDVVDDHLPGITAPALVVWGADDGLLPLAAGEFYCDRIPGAKMVVIEKGNHTPMQWTPEEFIAEVEKFMAEK
jgi:pimeloyl-ACP methyl ester carboxylesterase